MPAPKSSARKRRPAPVATEAQLFVADVRIACDFYTTRLGFTVAFVYGDPPFYAQVTRGRGRINLRAVGEPVFAGDVRDRERLLSATLTLPARADIERLHAEYRAARVPIADALATQPWGATTFCIADPDGNLVLFAAPAGSRPAKEH